MLSLSSHIDRVRWSEGPTTGPSAERVGRGVVQSPRYTSEPQPRHGNHRDTQAKARCFISVLCCGVHNRVRSGKTNEKDYTLDELIKEAASYYKTLEMAL